jgi:predicted GTPase
LYEKEYNYKGLRAAMITAVDLKQAMRTMSETADTLMHLKMDEIEKYFDDGTSVEETLSYIGELVKAITSEIQTISSATLKCILSVGEAEEKLLNALVSEDDAIHVITLSQLASYIAKDDDMMKRVKALIMK